MIRDIFDDIFAQMDAWMRYPFEQGKLVDNGLKGIIKTPHNLYTVKNDKGAIEKQVLEVVYTPFAAKDVTVDVENGVLVIKIGNEKFKEKDADSMIYHGISSQTKQFELKLSSKCDVSKITAQAVDGILRIELPVKAEEQAEPQRIPIAIAGAEMEQKQLA